jgi:hypothetical protein
MGPGSFQAVINKQLLDHADLLVGIIGKRLGTPTEKSIAGTVEEIEKFIAQEKPVLLYFSDQPYSLSTIDVDELNRVNEFRKSIQKIGLYLPFKEVKDLKALVRSHLDSVLQGFNPLLVPAGRVLAYGYFVNFIARTYQILRGRKIVLPDYALTLSYSSFRIRIAKPISLDEATDNSVFSLRQNFLEEINIELEGQTRRAFRVYIRKDLHARLKLARDNRNKTLSLDVLDVLDFPTPIIALNKFVQDLEGGILKKSSKSGLGYWQRQKRAHYDEFFDMLDKNIDAERLARSCFNYFEYRDDPGFNLPD